jgi:hypothetical protein
MTQSAASPRPRSRTWLYGPFIALGLLAAAWSGFWFYARGKSEDVLDRIIAREAGLGRQWTCQDRTISGFPFRFEARCSAIALTAARTNGAVSVTGGALVIVAQIYNPQHIVLKATGPAIITQPDGAKTTLRWSSYDSSFHLSGLSFDGIATVIINPQVETRTGQTPFKAAFLEWHGRRNPTRFASDGVIDISLSARAAILPPLDELAGNDTPADIDLTASLTRALVFMTGLKPENLDLWRTGGGRTEITKLAITKGTGRFETKGELGLDDQRRLIGRLEPSAAGIDRIAGIPVGSIGGLLSGRPAASPAGAPASLRPLPTVEFRDGRVQAGPLRIPRLQLSPLY